MQTKSISAFIIQSFSQPSTPESISRMQMKFHKVPSEYLELVSCASELELTHENGGFLRVYGADDAIEMDDGYDISENLEGAIPIGDDGNSRAVFYWTGILGWGLYTCSYGSLFPEDVVFIAPSLQSLLKDGIGADKLLV